MKDGWIQVAAANFAVHNADVEYNAQRIAECIAACNKNGARLIVFPQLALTGDVQDLLRQSVMTDGILEGLRKVAKASLLADAVVVVGAPLVCAGKLFDCAVVYYGGELLGVVPNRHPDPRYFQTPTNECEIRVGGMTRPFGCDLTFVCEGMESFVLGVEVGAPEAGAYDRFRSLAARGATVIANPRMQPQTADLPEIMRDEVKYLSSETISAIVVSQPLDDTTTDAVYGGCKCIAENGELLAQSDPFTAQALYADVDTDALTLARRTCATFAPVQENGTVIAVDMEVKPTRLTRRYTPNPFLPVAAGEKTIACARMLQMQAYGLAKRMRHTGAQRLVVGVSGGSDSTLTMIVSALALDVCKRPRTDLIALTMPAFGTTSRTRSNAELLAEQLGAELHTVDITQAVLTHFADIGQPEGVYDAAYENAQARERTQVLMDYANRVNGLVVGTGDMSESALGWTTYNGDHMSMYNPNASVPKTVVRELIAFYAARCAKPELQRVLQDILDTPISPELLPTDGAENAQHTEKIVGPYELHDFVLYWAIGRGYAPCKIYRMAQTVFQDKLDAEQIAHWMQVFYKRFFSQQFKRSCMPDGACVCAFGLSPRSGWHMPSDATATLWLQQVSRLTEKKPQ